MSDTLREEALVALAGKAVRKVAEYIRETEGSERDYCLQSYFMQYAREVASLFSGRADFVAGVRWGDSHPAKYDEDETLLDAELDRRYGRKAEEVAEPDLCDESLPLMPRSRRTITVVPVDEVAECKRRAFVAGRHSVYGDESWSTWMQVEAEAAAREYAPDPPGEPAQMGCPKCGSIEANILYDDSVDILYHKCKRCDHKWSTLPLDKRPVVAQPPALPPGVTWEPTAAGGTYPPPASGYPVADCEIPPALPRLPDAYVSGGCPPDTPMPTVTVSPVLPHDIGGTNQTGTTVAKWRCHYCGKLVDQYERLEPCPLRNSTP